jgi:Acyl-ACP thioesterase.
MKSPGFSTKCVDTPKLKWFIDKYEHEIKDWYKQYILQLRPTAFPNSKFSLHVRFLSHQAIHHPLKQGTKARLVAFSSLNIDIFLAKTAFHHTNCWLYDIFFVTCKELHIFVKKRNAMKTFEHIVEPIEADSTGFATVPSICSQIINAIDRSVRVNASWKNEMERCGKSLVLLRSAFEIDERPKVEDNYNVSIWNVNENRHKYHRCIRITDHDGHEIGRGTTEWCIVDSDTGIPVESGERSEDAPPVPCRKARRMLGFNPDNMMDTHLVLSDYDCEGHIDNARYIELFYNLLPERLRNSGLSIRLDMNFKGEPRKGDEMFYGIKKKNEDRYLFVARTGSRDLCHASIIAE